MKLILSKSVKICQNYGHESVAPFLGPPCMFLQPPSVDKCGYQEHISLITVMFCF